MKRFVVILLLFIQALTSLAQEVNMVNPYWLTVSDTCGAWTNQLGTDLISLLEFNEPSGTTAYDSYGSADGTGTSTTPYQPGILDRSWYLNNAYVTIPNTGGRFNAGSAFTVSMWLAVANASISSKAAICLDPTSTSSWKFMIYLTGGTSTDYPLFYVRTTSGTASCGTTYSNGSLFDGSWFHVVGVYDASLSTERLKFYINGNKIASATGYAQAMQTTTADLSIGRWQIYGNDEKLINTYVDQVGFWGRAFNQDDVDSLYLAGNGTEYCAPPNTSTPQYLQPYTITSDAAWCWFQKDYAIYDSISNKTWLGIVSDSGSGDTQHIVEINNDDLSQSITSVGSQTEKDDHNQPSILLKSDGKLFIAYSEHSHNPYVRYRTSTNVKDATSWGAESTFKAPGDVTYPSAFEATNGDIYIFFRVQDDGMYYIKSTDDGVTFSSSTKYVDNFAPVSINYHRMNQSPVDKDIIHFINTNGHPEEDPNISAFAYYFDCSDDTFHDLTGTDITTNIPFDTIADGTLIYTTTDPNTAWIDDIIVDNNGNPRYLFTYYPNGKDTAYVVKELYYTEWTGDSIITPVKIHTSATTINLGGSNDPAYPPLASFNKYNLNEIYAGKEVDSISEIFKVIKTGYSFSEIQLTENSTYNQWRPIVIGKTGNEYNVFWLNQITYNGYTSYNQSLKTFRWQ